MRQFGWAAALMIVTSVPAQAQGGKACPYEPLGTGRVAAVKDGRTLVLDDGREIRLAGIEVPALESDPGGAAKDALTEWTRGKDLRLSRAGAGRDRAAGAERDRAAGAERDRAAGAEHDRYGRVLAHVFLDDSKPAQSVQQRLLAAGHARLTGRGPCAADSLVFERQARTANLGLWADPYYQVKRAEHAAEVLAQRGRYAIVEGTVLSVRESGGTIYVNFGRRWSEDFTATIPKRNERAFVAAGLAPKQLERRRVRVRGWIEERGGPWIDVTGPEQIEIAERK